MSVYASVAPRYRDAGWAGVLPLPARRKDPPPSGFTGAAADPTEAEVEDWAAGKRYRATVDGVLQWISPDNIALRLPVGVIGYDADLYKPEGRETHAALVAECGELPPTWVSTSRDDGSGIRFYRVPEGVKLGGAFGGVEIIQRGHRYAVVAPSIHPEGRPYRWISPDGDPSEQAPGPDQLPELPVRWLERLRRPAPGVPSSRPRLGSTGEWARCVRDRFADAVASLTEGSRHDRAVEAAMALVRYDDQGYPGAGDALASLGADFRARIADRAGSAEAEAEWDRIVTGARAKVRATPSTIPRWEDATEHARQQERRWTDEVEAQSAANGQMEVVVEGSHVEVVVPVAPTWVDSYAHLEFPLDVLPPDIARFVEQTARSTSVHHDMVATCVLPVLATAIGNSRSLFVKDDWEERARVYAGIIGESGTRKTPPQRKAVEPLVAIQRDLDRENAAELAEWEELPDKERRRSQRPPYRQLVMNDTTTEAVAKVLDAHPRGVLLERGELSGWMRSFGQYKGGRGDDRQKWLEFYDGLRSAVNRSSLERPIVLQRPFVCVLGGIQPAVLGRLLELQDGFAQRFLYAVPPAVEELAGSPPVDRAVRGTYEAVVRELYAIPTALGDAIPLRVTDEGREALLGQVQRLMDERRNGALPAALRSYWAKSEGLLPRLVIVLAEAWRVCGGGTGEVTPAIVELAAAVVDFYKGQALVVLGDEGIVPPAREFGRAGPAAIAELVEWVRRHGGEATFRELMWSGPRSVRELSREEARRAVDEAIDRGLLARERGKRTDQVVLRVVS